MFDFYVPSANIKGNQFGVMIRQEMLFYRNTENRHVSVKFKSMEMTGEKQSRTFLKICYY